MVQLLGAAWMLGKQVGMSNGDSGWGAVLLWRLEAPGETMCVCGRAGSGLCGMHVLVRGRRTLHTGNCDEKLLPSVTD
ncbi:hypothetical protein DPMN_000574 [Dreissena polymorpha]|uniref:Uncharacterized protein n=1 Tax=Dreissena polymorpha TaxID=45954 RepID=A0A9D4MG36_DREPO|nr:hypothetical protein DPMN_000574 [Dreissena polymorpha]